MMLKNFLFYAFALFINTWAAEQGGGEVFRVFGIVSLALLALCIPMCKFTRSCSLIYYCVPTACESNLRIPWNKKADEA